MKLTGLLACTLLAVCAPLAQADLLLYVGFDGSTPGVVEDLADNGTILYSNSTLAGGAFVVSDVVASSNSPGTPGLAKEVSATLDIDNTDTISHTLVLQIVAQDFTAPVAPPSLSLFSQIGGSFVATGSGTNSLSFTSCVDSTNSNTACAAGSTQTSTGTVPILFPTGDSSTTTITSLTGPYTISEDLVLTLGAGADINFSANTKLTAVPEPVNVGWLAGGIVLLGGFVKVKRARRAKQA